MSRCKKSALSSRFMEQGCRVLLLQWNLLSNLIRHPWIVRVCTHASALHPCASFRTGKYRYDWADFVQHPFENLTFLFTFRVLFILLLFLSKSYQRLFHRHVLAKIKKCIKSSWAIPDPADTYNERQSIRQTCTSWSSRTRRYTFSVQRFAAKVSFWFVTEKSYAR